LTTHRKDVQRHPGQRTAARPSPHSTREQCPRLVVVPLDRERQALLQGHSVTAPPGVPPIRRGTAPPPRGGVQMTTAIPAIQVGSLAIATRTSGVCDVGERSVCDEVYARGGRPGYSFLFEQGRYDGFSPEDVALFLTITGEVCAAVAAY